MVIFIVNVILNMEELKEGQQLPGDCEDFDDLLEWAQELKDAISVEICNYWDL